MGGDDLVAGSAADSASPFAVADAAQLVVAGKEDGEVAGALGAPAKSF
jgi:hypothetical protein